MNITDSDGDWIRLPPPLACNSSAVILRYKSQVYFITNTWKPYFVLMYENVMLPATLISASRGSSCILRTNSERHSSVLWRVSFPSLLTHARTHALLPHPPALLYPKDLCLLLIRSLLLFWPWNEITTPAGSNAELSFTLPNHNTMSTLNKCLQVLSFHSEFCNKLATCYKENCKSL